MEDFDIYEDLELLHAQEKLKATEDLKWKDKYEVALITIQKFQTEKKEFNKKIKQLETNFASLFDTARAEIKRKDKQICELRKQKDDICFRRTKPQNAGRHLTDNADARLDASSESVRTNPFWRESRKEKNLTNSELSDKFLDDKHPSKSSKELLENGKRNFDKFNNHKQHVPRNGSRERGHSRDRQRHRLKDRSRHRNRSRDRVDERSRHRSDARNETRHTDRSYDRKHNRIKERSHRKYENNNEIRRTKRRRDTSEARSSDSGSWDKADKIHSHSQRKNHTNEEKTQTKKLEEKPRDTPKSRNDLTKDQTNASKIELNKPKSPVKEKRVNPKIEILQIEILKDVKQLKKNQLNAEPISKLDSSKVATEKSNQFLEALFDDAIMNKTQETSCDLYEDLLVSTQPQTDLLTDANKKDYIVEKDENLNFPKSTNQSVKKLIDDQNLAKSIDEFSSDSDLALIENPVINQKDKITPLGTITTTPVVEEIVLDDSCSDNDEIINKNCLDMKPPKNPITIEVDPFIEITEIVKLNDGLLIASLQPDLNDDKLAKIDENCNVKHQTPQKQSNTKLLEELFGPSPGDSAKKKSITSMDESSSDITFEQITKSGSIRIDEGRQNATTLKVPIVIEQKCQPSFPHSTEEKKEVEEFLKKDESNKGSNSSKHNLSSHNSNSAPGENHHRSKSEKRKHHHHHHHHEHHKDHHKCSRKHSKTKLNVLPRDQTDNKNVCLNDKHGSTALNNVISDDRSSPMLVYYDDDNVNSQHQKITDQDQVFFLHCDNISDDEILAQNEYKNLSNDNNEKNQEKEIMDRQDLDKNVIGIEPTDVFSIQTNKAGISQVSEESEITNELESDKKDNDSLESNDKPFNSLIPLINTECIVLSLEEEPQAKELTLTNSANTTKDALSSEICENPSDIVCSSIDLEKTDKPIDDTKININITNRSTPICGSKHSETCCSNTSISGQKLSEDLQSENFQKSSDVCDFVENPIVKQSKENARSEMKAINDSKIEENSEAQKSESHKNDQIAHESLNKTKENVPPQKRATEINIEKICSPEVDMSEQKKHTHDERAELSSISIPLCYQAELNKNTNVPNNEKFNTAENDSSFSLLNSDKKETNLTSNGSNNIVLNNEDLRGNYQQALTNEQHISNEKLETSLGENMNSENSSDCRFVIKEPVDTTCIEFPSQQMSYLKEKHCKIIPHTIDNLLKPSVISPKETFVGPETNFKEEICSEIKDSICSTNDLVSCSKVNQIISHSTQLHSSSVSPQKSLSSADKLKSSQSKSNFVSPGRRKKINSPQKRTGVCRNALNTTPTMVSDRNIKSDEVPALLLLQSDSISTSSGISSTIISPDKNRLSHCTKPEVVQCSPSTNKNITLGLEMLNREENCEKKSDTNEKQIAARELNGSLVNEKEITSDIFPQQIQNTIIEKREQNTLSSSLCHEYLQQPKKQRQQMEEPTQSTSIPLSIDDQQYTNPKTDEDFLQNSISPSTTTEYSDHGVKNTEKVPFMESDKTEKLHLQTAVLKEVEEELESGELTSETNDSLLSSELNESKNTDEKGGESFCITIKMSRKKKKKIKHSTEFVEPISNEVVNATNKTSFPDESPENLVNAQVQQKDTLAVVKNKKYLDHMEQSNIEAAYNACSSSFVNNTTLNSSVISSSNSEQSRQQQSSKEPHIMKHVMDSELTLFGTSKYPPGCKDQDVHKIPKGINVKKRKRKTITTPINSSLDSSDSEIKNKSTDTSPTCATTNVHIKRRHTNKTTQILDSSIEPNDDNSNQKKLKVMEDFKSPDLIEPTKKRKYKKKNSKNTIDSTNISNVFCERLESPSFSSNHVEHDNSFENVNDKLHPSQQSADILHFSIETTDSNIAIEEKERRKNKRKLSKSSEELVVQTKRSKNILENNSASSIEICDTSCPDLGKSLDESINIFEQSPSREKYVPNSFTPTHKIFSNDVFPSNPPPVYNASDDVEYNEIDDRMSFMFRSPIKKGNVDDTLNLNESTKCDTSMSSRKVSLGSSEYVIESIGPHTANVFIKRKKSKKRTKIVTTAV